MAMVEPSEETRADVALIDRIVARDQSAIAELYDRYNRLLFGLILRILKERSEAEDVLQEVFLAAWTSAHTYKAARGTPAGWLVRIARNRAIDRLRATSVRLRVIDESYSRPLTDASELQAARGEQQRAVKGALDALPADQRALIEDAYFLGLTHSELAARFSVPLGTVKTRIRAGMLALRQLLQDKHVAP
jgi:RNA polymerase sigma-70 factor (ECF subfamily)